MCALLVIVAGGLVVWALSLQSDLNDQKDQTAAAEQQAQDASAQVDDINQAVSDLGDQLQQAGGEAQGKIQQAVDALKAKLAELRDQLTPPDSGGGSPGARGRAARRSRQRPTRRPRPRPPRQRTRRARPDPRNAGRDRGCAQRSPGCPAAASTGHLPERLAGGCMP